MARARKVCNVSGCSTVIEQGQSRCARHEAEAAAKHGTATARGYGSAGHLRFRRAVLKRDPVCVICKEQPSTEADHHPFSRKQLIVMMLNPNDPKYGRGLCQTCHRKETARHQPAGWNALE